MTDVKQEITKAQSDDAAQCGYYGQALYPGVSSEYTDEYTRYPLNVRHPKKLQEQLKIPNGPMDLNTTNSLDFVKHNVSDKPIMHEHDTYERPDVSLDTTTSYMKHFTGKIGKPATPIIRDQRKVAPGKFSDETLYNKDYIAWELCPRDSFAPAHTWSAPETKMATTTSVRSDFPGYNQPKRPSIRQPDNTYKLEGQFDDSTCYNSSYIAHDVPTRSTRKRPEWAGRKLSEFPPVTNDLSEYTARYKEKPIHKRMLVKRTQEIPKAEGPIESTTNNRLDYIKHPVSCRAEKKRREYQQPQGNMDLVTSYNKTFTGETLPRIKCVKRKERVMQGGDFSPSTQYNTHYVKWDCQKRRSFAPKSGYSVPTVKMATNTTLKSDFPGHSQPMRKSMKGPGHRVGTGDPFIDLTNYRVSYINHPIPAKFTREKKLWLGPGNIVPMGDPQECAQQKLPLLAP